jgi:predicted patatin/cPLA2 family phospholipase
MSTVSVRDLLLARLSKGSQRNHRDDSFHLALVIEGGGMRGVVAGGMVSALETRNLLACFDSIHGSSAGACAGAYFVAQQARLGTRIYYEDINNKSFIDVRRALTGRPIMNTHFLIDHVMRVIKPLDVEKIISQPDFLYIVATDAKSGEARRYSRFRDAAHFFSILKGTITIPVIGGAPVLVDDLALSDGGMLQQIALDSALEVEPSHILVLMTRRLGEIERPDGGLRLKTEALILRLFYNADFARVYSVRNANINKTLQRIAARNSLDRVTIHSVARPAHASQISRLTTDTDALMRADQEAQQAIFRYLDGE